MQKKFHTRAQIRINVAPRQSLNIVKINAILCMTLHFFSIFFHVFAFLDDQTVKGSHERFAPVFQILFCFLLVKKRVITNIICFSTLIRKSLVEYSPPETKRGVEKQV
jgi:hypothetical protein